MGLFWGGVASEYLQGIHITGKHDVKPCSIDRSDLERRETVGVLAAMMDNRSNWKKRPLRQDDLGFMNRLFKCTGVLFQISFLLISFKMNTMGCGLWQTHILFSKLGKYIILQPLVKWLKKDWELQDWRISRTLKICENFNVVWLALSLLCHAHIFIWKINIWWWDYTKSIGKRAPSTICSSVPQTVTM